MEDGFQVDRGPCSTLREGYEANSAIETFGSKPAWNFVLQMEQVLGEGSEPDPLFFVESWTIGLSAAAESFQQRSRRQQEDPRRCREFQDLDSFRPYPFADQSEPDAAAFFSSRAVYSSIADSSFAGWPPTQPLTVEDACRILGVELTSVKWQVRAAYRHMANRYHPDHIDPQSKAERQLATERMAAINEAYRLLSITLFKESD